MFLLNATITRCMVTSPSSMVPFSLFCYCTCVFILLVQPRSHLYCAIVGSLFNALLPGALGVSCNPFQAERDELTDKVRSLQTNLDNTFKLVYVCVCTSLRVCVCVFICAYV